MEINLPFDSADRTIDLVKLTALYYDKVNLFCPIDADNKLYNEHLLDSMKVLENSEVVTFLYPNIGDIMPTLKKSQDDTQENEQDNGLYSVTDYFSIRDAFMDHYSFLYHSKSELMQSEQMQLELNGLATDLIKLRTNLVQAKTQELR